MGAKSPRTTPEKIYITEWVMVQWERWSRFYRSALPCGVEECTLCMIDAPHFV